MINHFASSQFRPIDPRQQSILTRLCIKKLDNVTLLKQRQQVIKEMTYNIYLSHRIIDSCPRISK